MGDYCVSGRISGYSFYWRYVGVICRGSRNFYFGNSSYCRDYSNWCNGFNSLLSKL